MKVSSCFFTGPPNPENVPEDGKLKSEVMVKTNRRYYLDLKVIVTLLALLRNENESLQNPSDF